MNYAHTSAKSLRRSYINIQPRRQPNVYLVSRSSYRELGHRSYQGSWTFWPCHPQIWRGQYLWGSHKVYMCCLQIPDLNYCQSLVHDANRMERLLHYTCINFICYNREMVLFNLSQVTSSHFLNMSGDHTNLITAVRCWRVKTEPQGLEGLFNNTAAVFESIRDSICTRSISHPFSGYTVLDRGQRKSRKSTSSR
jgi:hypothetical protein